MDTGNALHGLAIAHRQAPAVDMLEHADVGGAVPGDRNVVIPGREYAGHGLGPQQLVAQLAIDEAMDTVQFAEQLVNIPGHRSDQLDQRLGVIGSGTRGASTPSPRPAGGAAATGFPVHRSAGFPSRCHAWPDAGRPAGPPATAARCVASTVVTRASLLNKKWARLRFGQRYPGPWRPVRRPDGPRHPPPWSWCPHALPGPGTRARHR